MPKRVRQLLSMAGSTLLGGIAGAATVTVALRFPMVKQLFKTLELWHVSLLLPIGFLTILIHELGHLAGGMLRGTRFLLLVVGPFQWTARAAGGVRFGWNFNPSIMGGLAAATPARDRPLQPQLMGLVIGGPLASLLLGVGTVMIASQFENHVWVLLLLTGLMSLMIFLVTAIPFRSGGMQSDGWQLIELLWGGASVVERQMIIEIMGYSLSGQRPRDWDRETVRQLEQLESREPVRQIAARLQALYHAWDREEMARVETLAAWLDQHLEEYPAGFRQAIHLELALLALSSGRPGDVKRHVDASKGGMVDPARRQLLTARLAFQDGQREECRRAILAARKALPRGMDAGLNLLTASQLDQLAAEAGLAERTGAPPPDHPVEQK